jgi:hypothetical protein
METSNHNPMGIKIDSERERRTLLPRFSSGRRSKGMRAQFGMLNLLLARQLWRCPARPV